MAIIQNFTFNGKSTADYGLLVTGRRVFGAPARKVEKFSVPGRNGDILVDTGAYENYIVAYDVALLDFKTDVRAITNWLLSSSGYSKLTDTYDTTHYRMGACYSSIEYVTTALNREGTATIEFDCKPQRFLLSGETTTTITASSATVTNPSSLPSNPLLRVYGTGTVTVNGTTITVNAVNSYVDIDCEAQQAYKGTTNCNNDITVAEFPTLAPGNNTIAKSGPSKIELTPRWWEL